jgi:predicted N-acetyltransferase YhbS
MSSAAQLASIAIRQAKPEDAAACGSIFYEAFAGINRAHGFAPELPSVELATGVLDMLFSHPSFYCIVAEEGGRVIGSNCLDERSRVAGLGPVSVDPGAQNCGVGRALMVHLLERVKEQGFLGVRLLQSAFHGRSLSLYSKLGFVVREPIAAMSGLPAVRTAAADAVRAAVESDVSECFALCERVHGFVRTGELHEAVAQGVARVVEREGRVTGYACGFGYFGHAVAETTDDLKALISSAEEVGGPGILVPMRNGELFRWCLESRMRVLQPMTLMTAGMYEEPKGAYLPSVLY